MNADIERNAFGVFYGNISLLSVHYICRIIKNSSDLLYISNIFFLVAIHFVIISIAFADSITFSCGYNGNG